MYEEIYQRERERDVERERQTDRQSVKRRFQHEEGEEGIRENITPEGRIATSGV